MKIISPTGAIVVSTVCMLLTACDEETPVINEINALRAASCALSPTTFSQLGDLAFTLEQQTAASCVNGGVLLRTETQTSSQITADHCVTANNTTLNGTFKSTDIAENPITLDWDFDHISSTTLDSGSAVHGLVRTQQSESDTDFLTTFSFDSLSLDEIENALATGNSYGASFQTITYSKAHGGATIEYNSLVEQCGFDLYPLDVNTIEPLVQLQSETAPSSGVVEATAQDGSKLSITLSGDLLAIDLDSNGDSVDDLRLSMSWGEFNTATIASRSHINMPDFTVPLPRFKSRPH